MSTSIAAVKRGGAALLVGTALALGAAACGDDEETESVSTPTAPAQTSEEADTTDEAATEEETTTEDSGGVGPGEVTETEEDENEGLDGSGGGVGPSSGSGGHDPGQPDSADNDVPPEPGSPQEAFEQYCDENPKACG